jgi:hypothetical protein
MATFTALVKFKVFLGSCMGFAKFLSGVDFHYNTVGAGF